MSGANIESNLNEARVFPPSKEFSNRSGVSSMEAYEALYKRSLDDPDGFWRNSR